MTDRLEIKKEIEKMYSRLKAQQLALNEEVEHLRFLLDTARKRKADTDEKLGIFKFLFEPEFLLTPVSSGSSGSIIQGRVKLPKEYRNRMDKEKLMKYWTFVVGKQSDLPPMKSEELEQIASEKASDVVLRRIDFNLLI
jgi:DNA-binding transcriptional regulator/RsmH inhibitor MraZ